MASIEDGLQHAIAELTGAGKGHKASLAGVLP